MQIKWIGADDDTGARLQQLLPEAGRLKYSQDWKSNYTALQKEVQPKIQAKGYLAFSIDSLVQTGDSSFAVYYYLGQPYKWVQVSFDSLPKNLLGLAEIDPANWRNKEVKPQQVAALGSKILDWCDNNGFPFARLKLQIREDTAQGWNAGFVLDKGPFRKIDSIVLKGELKMQKPFLMRYLDIREGEIYSEKKLKHISSRLRELPYLREKKPWELHFKRFETHLELYLNEKKANQLYAIIGIAPSSIETNKMQLTADALVALQNALGYGESINVSYQNLQYKSPRLKAALAWPYLLNTPFGVDGSFDYFSRFDIVKNTIAFRRTTGELGVRYQLSANDYVKVFYKNQSNRVIDVDTAYALQYHKLPENADVANSGIGISWRKAKTDYILNPRKGWILTLTANVLNRTVRKNDALLNLRDASGFDFTTLYDSLSNNKMVYFLEADFATYQRFHKSLTLKIAYNGAYRTGENLFKNELYQIGGYRLLRGFDEQSVYASMYHVLSLELRTYFDQDSYFYLFSDNAYVQAHTNLYNSEGMYNGFGAGAALSSANGLFTINYALGTNPGNPLQFRQSKIHFGYIAYF